MAKMLRWKLVYTLKLHHIVILLQTVATSLVRARTVYDTLQLRRDGTRHLYHGGGSHKELQLLCLLV